MTEHIHTFKASPVPVRKNHNLIIFLVLLVVFFPLAFLYLIIPRGQETQIQSRCSECGAPGGAPLPSWENGNPCYKGTKNAPLTYNYERSGGR